MSNEIYEFSGIVDVLLKCKVDVTIAGAQYKAGEPYTYLKDVDLHTQYNIHTAGGSGRMTAVNTREGEIDEINLLNVPLTTKIADLIFTKDSNGHTETYKETIVCWEDGQLSLTKIPLNGVFCYDDQFNLINITNIADQTVFGAFEVNKEYLVFYNIHCDEFSYGFMSPIYPYFELQIFGKGNKDKSTRDLFMLFPKASLISNPRLNNLGGGIISTALTFKIVYAGKEDMPLIVFK